MNTSGTSVIPAWPRTAPPPLASARLRVRTEDFTVEERMPYVPTGSGEHAWLKLRKRGLNTDQVARLLARAAGVTRREVSYAGMKDRHAVTVQWFSVHLPGRPDPNWRGALPPEVELLECARHTRKLQTGALAGNAFDIVLRECAGEEQSLMRRITDIRAHGVPNYFGEQRFGRGGENVARARALFGGERVHDRHLRGIFISAARSYLFNTVLAQRVTDGSWRQVLDGEACILAGTRSFFIPEMLDDTIARRLAEFDIHPSGPLWGRGEPPTRSTARTLEESVIANEPELARGLETEGLKQERRALRLIPEDLRAEWIEAGVLRLQFSLPAGCFATALLRELANYQDVAGLTPEA